MRHAKTVCQCGLVAIALFLALSPAPRSARAQSLPVGYEHFTSAVNLWVDGAYVVIQANAVPDHKSPYFATSDPRYEAYNGTNPNFQLNPNRIATQTIQFRIPANPQEATTHAATPLGPIGVAINGVPLFNQYAGPNQPLTNEINSFDQYDGHPQMTGMYHYHVEPYALSAVNGRDSLIGYLLDGYPVYGPEENGVILTSKDLDQYHGHFGPTIDHPEGIYHYNITADSPYINGIGFYGTAGTVTYTFSSTPTPGPSAAPTTTATATATPTSTPDPSVGGIAEAPGLPPAADSSSTHRTAYELLAAAIALVAVSVAAIWTIRRRASG
jgi:hypothetical protein